MSRWNVVLAGGTGSRFWPMSTPQRPKQLLPLVGDEPMLVETVTRMAPLASVERTLILTNAELRDRVIDLLPSVPAVNIIAEPRPAGTCAALAWAAQVIALRDGPDAVMTCVHADWAIGDIAGFRTALARAADVAEEEQALVTVGIVPSRPDPGFGYIQPGAVLHDDVRRVERFVEKPDEVRAATMVEAGYLWNSGIFAWRAGDLLSEIRALTPEVWPALDAHGTSAEEFFAAVTSIAIDVGVLERSKRVLVMAGAFGWDDVGTWSALYRVRKQDSSRNAIHGVAHTLEAYGNVVHSEEGAVVLYGVDDLVVVSRAGLTLVTTREKASALKVLLDSLPPEIREL